MPQRSPESSPRRAPSAGRAVKLLAGFLAASVGAGVLVAGIAAPAVIAAGRTSNDVVGAFNDLPSALEQPPLSQQSRILYADGSPMATFYYENRISVPLDQVNEVMRTAIVAIEDNRFYEHGGVDPRGLTRALVQNAQGGDVQGASTLTQQWIKNVQVEEALSDLPTNASAEERQAAFNDVTVRSGLEGYTRKLREMKLAIAAEKQYPKDTILENYLNIANFGGGQYGVEAASRHWFNRSAKDIDLPQAALLAGIVQNPVGYDPVKNPQDAQGRRDVVLNRMLQLGVISQADHDAATAIPIDQMLDVQPTPNGCEQAGQAGFFCDYAVKQFRDDDAFGGTKEERLKLLYRGGLTITTTLDPGKQQAAFEEVANAVPVDSSVPTNHISGGKVVRDEGTSNLGAAISSVEPGTGKIRAMAQNRTYSTAPDAPFGYTSINYNTDKSEGGSSGFQPGSNFKPFVLVAWLNSGRTLNATVNGVERTYPNSSWQYGDCAPGAKYTDKPYAPGNAGDGEESGTMPVIQATYDSVNTGYAAMENQLPLCDVRAAAEALGVHKAAVGQYPTVPGTTKDTRLDVLPSMMLGSNEVSPLTIATAYAAFAARGNYCAPTAIEAITDSSGQPLTVPGPQCNQAISQPVADGVNYALQRVLTEGTAAGRGLAGGREAAGKTGTTNYSVATWFTGYTPQLATSVWIGVPEKSMSLNGATIAGQRRGTMYGGTVAAPMWQDYMNRALEGTEQVDFTDPPQNIIGRAPAPPRPQATRGPSGGGGGGQTSAPADGGGQGGDQGQGGDGQGQGGPAGGDQGQGGGDQGGGQGQGPGGTQGTTVEPAPEGDGEG